MQHADIRFFGSILMPKYFDSVKLKQSPIGIAFTGKLLKYLCHRVILKNLET